jgi:hypothetical protein
MLLGSLFHRAAAPALAVLLVRSASAVCQVPQPRIVCAEYANSKAVVIANLRATQHIAERFDTDGQLYSLTVRTLLRGDVGTTFQIWEGNDSGRATFDWKVGTDYLLFLARYVPKPIPAWVIDGCGNSGPTSGSATVLQAIKSAQASTSDSLVSGMVSTDSWTTGVPDVIVRAVGARQSFSAKTDQGGRFLLRLPNGKYMLEAAREGWSFMPGYGYENPRNLNVSPGYCAQVHFSGAERK